MWTNPKVERNQIIAKDCLTIAYHLIPKAILVGYMKKALKAYHKLIALAALLGKQRVEMSLRVGFIATTDTQASFRLCGSGFFDPFLGSERSRVSTSNGRVRLKRARFSHRLFSAASLHFSLP
ncbi:hypothetical protein NDU88_001571 [Pleurodeles waltl]|uniref:Uncharacterized protein n=1 Tax=Pleurodeles waltl TaxID=8319 RepID=A0AAV7MLA4_PLEWA|nr:hypothetical protein NDU88_001571 [Pleurodeles waltl]